MLVYAGHYPGGGGGVTTGSLQGLKVIPFNCIAHTFCASFFA